MFTQVMQLNQKSVCFFGGGDHGVSYMMITLQIGRPCFSLGMRVFRAMVEEGRLKAIINQKNYLYD